MALSLVEAEAEEEDLMILQMLHILTDMMEAMEVLEVVQEQLLEELVVTLPFLELLLEVKVVFKALGVMAVAEAEEEAEAQEQEEIIPR